MGYVQHCMTEIESDKKITRKKCYEKEKYKTLV